LDRTGGGLAFSVLPDPWLSYCAPCAACAGVYDAAAASCTCTPTPSQTVYTNPADGPVDWALAQGPDCSLRTGFHTAGTCFPAAARVLTEGGAWVRLDALPTSTRVLAADPVTGALAFSPVLAWWHHERDVLTSFLQLTTASGARLTLTANHYVHAAATGCDAGWASAALVLPPSVRVGQACGCWMTRPAS
jgi:hypothetical protein